MDLYVVKVKNEDLFFNADEMVGEYISPLPLVVPKETAYDIMRFAPDEIPIEQPFYGLKFNSEKKSYSKSDLEIKKIKIVYE